MPDGALQPDVPDERAADAWRRVGARMTLYELWRVESDLQDAFADVERALRAGEPLTAAHVAALRDAKDDLQRLTETTVAPLADGVEPWDGGPGDIIPFAVMRDALADSGVRAREARADE
jgi:hypothetical protein